MSSIDIPVDILAPTLSGWRLTSSNSSAIAWQRVLILPMLRGLKIADD